MHENESIYIPIGSVHRLANPGKIPLEMIEVQTGSYLGEDDIVRLEDIYKRKRSQRTDQLTRRRRTAAMMRSCVGFVEIGVHRQADDLVGQPVADRDAAVADRIMLVGLLPVQRDRVIDRGRDAFGLERRGEARRAGRPARGWCIAPTPRSSRPAPSARSRRRASASA